jgi:CheY-like chemotaxis protein
MPTVLLVDDDPDNRHLLRIWLTMMGHRVLEASSAVEALHALDEHGVPDVAILDIVMERISGLDLLDHLRHHDPSCAQMPAILLTAREQDSDEDEAGTLNARLMKKPIDRAALADAIGRALEPAGR